MPNYYELKGTFMRACEWHQEGNANEGGVSVCSLCRYGADGEDCFAHWMFDVLSGNFAKTDKLTEYRTLTERKSANVTGEIAENDEKSPNACKKTAQIGKDINVPATDVVFVNLPYIHPKKTSATDTNVGCKLPAWCKEGAWVFYDGYLLGKIVSLEKYSNPTYAVVVQSYTLNSINQITTRFVKPVRFRQYRHDEAKGLIGKVLEIPEKDGFCGIDLICSVSYDRESGEVLINGESFKSLSKDGCLIDGRPIGVPVVDEEALEGGAE